MRNLLAQVALAAYLAVHLGGPAWHGWLGPAHCRLGTTCGPCHGAEHADECHHAEDCPPAFTASHAQGIQGPTAGRAVPAAEALGASSDACGLCQFLAQAPLRVAPTTDEAGELAPVGRIFAARSSHPSLAPIVALARGPPSWT